MSSFLFLDELLKNNTPSRGGGTLMEKKQNKQNSMQHISFSISITHFVLLLKFTLPVGSDVADSKLDLNTN